MHTLLIKILKFLNFMGLVFVKIQRYWTKYFLFIPDAVNKIKKLILIFQAYYS